MEFPEGTDGGTITSPQDAGAIRQLTVFAGIIEIQAGTGQGAILAENGTFLAAYFLSGKEIFRGKAALSAMGLDRGETDDLSFRLKKYTPEEFSRAVRIAKEETLFLAGGMSPASDEISRPVRIGRKPGTSPDNSSASAEIRLLDEEHLRKIKAIPGVIAVSAFFEGFPVQSVGDEDFEHVAALAEDFLRAGTKIGHELGIGTADQLILETPGHKCIIAPCRDLSLCILTTGDARLGLIRVLLRHIQKQVSS